MQSGRAAPEPDAGSIQSLVDALSVALQRPVLLDDPELHPLAYSRQWGELDPVRRESILGRGAPPDVRRALLDQRIAEAREVVRTQPVAALGMDERVCAPVRDGARTLGYLWLLDPAHELDDDALARVRETGQRIAALLAQRAPRRVPDEPELVARLCAPSADEREQAAREVADRGLLPDRPLVVCLLAARAAGADADAVAGAQAMGRRLSPGHVLLATGAADPALLVSLGDPVLAVLREEELARWLLGAADDGLAIGQSGTLAGLHDVAEGRRQAAVALRVARGRPAEPWAAWEALGAARLLAQLPRAAAADVPDDLRRLLRDEPELAATLAAFLDAAGDVKATAAALSLHRSGLYYRLNRIEQLSGLRLDDGDDRLLAHVAVRLAALERRD
jgi:hypothetical protein